MIMLDENKALAIIFANTKRKKRTADLITVAEAFEYLFQLYGSQKELSRKVNLSTEMIREFRKILTLPFEVKQMIRNKVIDSQDIAYRISKIKDPPKQIQTAKQILQMPSKDVRDMELLISNTGLTPNKSKKQVIESRLKGLHVFMIDFEDGEYEEILEQSRKAKLPAPEYVKRIVTSSINKAQKINLKNEKRINSHG